MRGREGGWEGKIGRERESWGEGVEGGELQRECQKPFMCLTVLIITYDAEILWLYEKTVSYSNVSTG